MPPHSFPRSLSCLGIITSCSLGYPRLVYAHRIPLSESTPSSNEYWSPSGLRRIQRWARSAHFPQGRHLARWAALNLHHRAFHLFSTFEVIFSQADGTRKGMEECF
jgi:hypothetical protein